MVLSPEHRLGWKSSRSAYKWKAVSVSPGLFAVHKVLPPFPCASKENSDPDSWAADQYLHRCFHSCFSRGEQKLVFSAQVYIHQSTACKTGCLKSFKDCVNEMKWSMSESGALYHHSTSADTVKYTGICLSYEGFFSVHIPPILYVHGFHKLQNHLWCSATSCVPGRSGCFWGIVLISCVKDVK